MLRLVLDTNTVLDLLHFRDATAAPIMQALRENRALCFTDARCSAELARVLRYPHFHLDEAQAEHLYIEYMALAQLRETEADWNKGALPPLPHCRDPDDQKFLELARAVQADLLVTKDKALLELTRRKFRLAGFTIVQPAEAALRLITVSLGPQDTALVQATRTE